MALTWGAPGLSCARMWASPLGLGDENVSEHWQTDELFLPDLEFTHILFAFLWGLTLVFASIPLTSFKVIHVISHYQCMYTYGHVFFNLLKFPQVPPVLPARRGLRGGDEPARLAVGLAHPHEAFLLGRQVAGPGRRQLPAGEEDPARGAGAAG